MFCTRQINLFFVLILLTLAISKIGKAQEVLIFNEYTQADTIDLGMCVLNDSIETVFNIWNLTGKRLQIGGNDYTFSIERAVDDPNNIDFFEFFGPPGLPQIIDSNSKTTIVIKYKPLPNLIQFPPGKKIVKLRLGVFDPQYKPLPQSLQDLVAVREFILVVRKSTNDLDSYDQIIDFDSVWINPVDTIFRTIVMQNNTFSQIIIDSILFYRSINAELLLERKSLPLTLNEYKSGEERGYWRLSYYPTNLGRDTGLIVVKYRNPNLSKDTVKTFQILVRGVGVQQKISVENVEGANVIDNFIDFGTIPLDTSKEAKIYIKNNGNLPFGFIEQATLDYFTEKPSEDYLIKDSLSGSLNLLPTQKDSFVVVFKPTRRDTILGRIVLNSNLPLRKVKGYPNSAREVVFYFRGVGLAPKLSVETNYVNFGNIIVNNEEGCPSIRDTVIKLSNNGNFVLRLEQIRLEPPYPQTPFKLLEENVEIPPYSTRNFHIVFDSIARDVGEFRAELIFISRFSKMVDTTVVQLFARGVLPDPIKITIPDTLKFKPGHTLSIPIIVDSNLISRARDYQDTISFNSTILRYKGYNRISTASERAEQIEIVPLQQNGKLAIYIKTRWNETFLSNFKLIELMFDTYLGAEPFTEFKFLSSRFGDGICSRVLSPQRKELRIYADSLCGISKKLFDGSGGFFDLKAPVPNPSNSVISINFDIPFETLTRIYIYDSFGQIVDIICDEVVKADSYQKILDISHYPRGLYFVRMQAGLYHKVEQFVVTH